MCVSEKKFQYFLNRVWKVSVILPILNKPKKPRQKRAPNKGLSDNLFVKLGKTFDMHG